MFTYAAQPRSPLKIIGDAFQLFKRSFSKVWLYQLGAVLAFGVMYFARHLTISMTNKSVGFDMLLILLVAAAIFFVIFVYLAILARMHRLVVQGDESFVAVKRIAFHKMWPYILLILVVWLAPPLVLVGLLMIAHDTIAAVSAVVWVVFALLAGFWVYSFVVCKLFAPILAVEGLLFAQTFKHGFALVRGQWWRTLWVWLLSSFILLVVSVGGGAIVGFIFGFAGAFMSGAATITNVAVTVLQAAVALVLPIFAIAVQLVQLNDLKLRYAAKKGLQLNA